jgi:hypothetical protein
VRVFAVFSERKAGLIRVWVRSWSGRGWAPQLISASEIKKYGTARRAAEARGKGLLSDLQVVNFAYPARSRLPRRVVCYGRTGWQTARLVRFPVVGGEDLVLRCGRAV